MSCGDPSFAPGDAVFTLVVHVDSLAGGSTLSNTATATSTTSDPNSGNEFATATTLVSNFDYYTVTPCRLVDTRPPSAPMTANEVRTFHLADAACAIPADAKALQVNITVVAGAASAIHLYRSDLSSTPPRSSSPSRPTRRWLRTRSSN